MELPQNLKDIYRHWDKHILPVEDPMAPENIFENLDIFEDISWFIKERMDIWFKKTDQKPKPYTDDPILSKYRFCNIFRELDRQTIEIHSMLNPLRDDFNLWLLNMFYCRLVARLQTIEASGLLSFDRSQNAKVYKRLLAISRPRYGTPYVFPVSVIQKSATPTRELFLTEYLPDRMGDIAQEIGEWKNISVSLGLERILPLFGFNLRFLWTEVLIDVAYQFPEKINLFKVFPIGPGSLPTFKRINTSIVPDLLAERLAKIRFNSDLTWNDSFLRLSAENWEGIGCEYRKYCNLKAGIGRKRLYI